MTKIEKIAVKNLYNLHCEIVDKVKAYFEAGTAAEKEIFKAQIDRMEDEIMELHDALIEDENKD